jgi:hypothetical protein
MPYIIDGRTYKVQFANIAAVGAVPSTREINTGSGLGGGGDLSANRTLYILPGGVDDSRLSTTGVTAGTYGAADSVPVLTVNAQGRVTGVTNTPIVLTNYVPTSRTISAGAGLTGGGDLSANRSFAVNFSSTTPEPLGPGSPGVSTVAAREDHVHPAVDLSDTTETQGVLPLSRGGTGNSLSPVVGAVVYSSNDKLYLTPTAGSVGQVLTSIGGTGAPIWTTLTGTGTVTDVSVVTANGFAGTVANPNTLPAITMQTTVSGMIKGNGTSISAATAGTDYVEPGAITTSGLTMATDRLLGRTTASAGAVEQITVGTGLLLSGGSLTNSAPDQTVSLTGGTAISISGTYPSFTITNTAPDQIVSLTGAGTTSITGTYPNFTITSNDQYVGTVTSVSGTGTVNGLTLTGTVTSSGSLTLGGTLSNVSLTSQVTGTLPVANGGTGASVAGTARTNLSAAASGANTDITSIALTTGTISATPTGGTDIVNKLYADSIASGINFHQSVRLATAAALPANTYNNGTGGVGATLTANANGALSVDSVAAVVGNRILVKNEVAQANNGVYTVTQVGDGSTPYILTRATDFDSAGTGVDQIDAGDFFLVTAGSTQSNTSWVQQTPLPITVGTTALVFTQFAAPVLYSAGTGLTLAGTVFSITNTGVSASTYGSASSVPVLAINAQGQVTSASSSSIAIAASQITSGTVTVAQGGTGATTLTGYVKGNGTSAFTASATIPASDISSGAALTKTDDTNVTLTLGGSPTTALLAATSITAGWTGQLAVSRGGTGASTLAANGVLLGNGTSAISATAVGTTGQVLVGNTGGAPTWATLSGIGVTSFSAGTTGLTPASATTGAITLAGTLNVANGGTGTATAFTAGSVVFAGASGVYTQDNANLFWDNTNDRLGIGTSSPTSKLHIVDENNAGFRLTSYSNTAGSILRISSALGSLASPSPLTLDSDLFGLRAFGYTSAGTFGAAAAQINGKAAESFTATAQGTYLNFLTTTIGSATPAERMRINDAGNVGIGTTSPGSKLDVVAQDAIRATGFQPFLTLRDSSDTNKGSRIQTASAITIFYNDTTGGGTYTERMRIDSSGNVGIGTSSVGGKFQVAASTLGQFIVAYNGTSVNYTDVDTNIFRSAAGTERMRIDSSGNVGIGTTSPSAPLTVKSRSADNIGYRVLASASGTGTIQFTDDPVTTGWASIAATSSALRLQGGTGVVTISTAATERMRIDSSGNVAIGNTSAAPKFSVTLGTGFAWGGGWSTASALFGGNGAASGAGSGGLGITYDDTDGGTIGPVIPGVAWKPLRLFSDNIQFCSNGATERMRIDSSGNVGIGTSSPAYKLDVNGDINFGASLTSGSGVSTGDCRFELGANRSASGNAYMDFHATAGTDYEARVLRGSGTNGVLTIENLGTGGMSFYNASAADVRFYTNTAERMRISSGGGVAIGGTSTDASLHIQQAYGGYDRLTQISPGSASKNAYNLMAARDSGNADLWWSWGVRDDNVWCFVPGVTYSMNPVTGIYFDSACAAYKPGGGTWTTTSDARVKTNIAPISDAASRIMALKPSGFDYRIPEAHQGRVSDRGFIAQEFEAVYPHSVTESAVVAEAEKAFITGGGKIKAIGLNNDFFADLVALVQEQQTTIQELTARVAQLEGK